MLESDDGSGWVKVADPNGRSGLIPASYLDTESSRSPGTSKLQNQERTGKHGNHPTIQSRMVLMTRPVRAIYSYEPQELELHEGEVLELSGGPTGGENYGNGWWEGKRPNNKGTPNLRHLVRFQPSR